MLAPSQHEIPHMAKSVTDGNGTTHFLDVFDGKKVIGTAMLFIPAAVSIVEQVPMLVYYHGHNSKNSIEDYVTSLKQRDFRPLLKGKKVLLVEPWGGQKSNFGAFGTGAGLATLIDYAMFSAVSYGPPVRPCPVKPPPPASLILAGFSGGGATVKSLVIDSKSPSLSLLSEAWCFDCMYSGEGAAWVGWAKANPTKTLRVRVSTGESTGDPRAQADVIRAKPLPNIDIDKTVATGHEDLPAAFIPTWL
jgi:hypothetical protein